MEHKKTILIIDDEADIVEALQDLLDGEGFQIISAHNGLEGLKKLSQISPDLIILDMNMPQMSGISFYQHVLDPKTQKPLYPILALTARTNLEALFQDFQIDGFMSKPFRVDDLLSTIRTILKRYHPEEEVTPVFSEEIKKKVLLVGVLDPLLHKATQVFLNQGHELFNAQTPNEIEKTVLNFKPDLIIVMRELINDSGDSVALKIKMHKQLKDIPMMIYTTTKSSQDIQNVSAIYQQLGVPLIHASENALIDLINQSQSFLADKRAA